LKAGWSILLTALFTLVRAEAPLYERLEELTTAKDFASFIDDKRAFSLYREALRQYYGEENFACEKLDTVLSDFQTLRKKVAGVEVEVWKKPSFPLLSLRPHSQSEPFTVRPLRAFHAMWFNTQAMGCGQTICEMADANAPERWAAVLKGAQYFAVERDGKFTGTMYLIVPIQNEGEIFAGIWTKESGSVPADLADQWLAQIKPSLPKEWKGVTRSIAGRQPADTAADAVHMALPRRCFGVKESRGANLLAGLIERGPAGNGALKVDINSQGAMADLLNTFQGPDQPGKIANVPTEQMGALKKSLGGILITDPDPKKRFKAADALGWMGQALKPVDLPALGASPTVASSYRVSPSEITPLLNKALNDSSPLVRGAAGVALSQLGGKSPAISSALNGLLGPNLLGAGKGSGARSGALPADVADLLRRGSRGILNGGGSLDGNQMGRLFDAAEQLPEGDTKKKLVETLATAYMKAKDPGSAMKFARNYFEKDPALMKQVAEKSNEFKCPKLPAYEKAVKDRMKNEAGGESEREL